MGGHNHGAQTGANICPGTGSHDTLCPGASSYDDSAQANDHGTGPDDGSTGPDHYAHSLVYADIALTFVPSAGGISHSPKELTRWEDTANGCEVLYRTVLAIDSLPTQPR
jgi:hypothetical protein